MNRLIKPIAILMTLAAASCGGGSGYGGGSNPSPGGIWMGTDSVSGLPLEGIVDEAGEFHFIRSDGAQWVGTATTSGNSITADAQELAPFGTTFQDGSTQGTGTITGTITERSSIQATYTFKTSMGTQTSGSINLSFNDAYYESSSLSRLADHYMYQNNTVTIDASGNISVTDMASRCTVSGTVTSIDATYNTYKVQGSFGGCQGASAPLNGVDVSGLGTLELSTCTTPKTFIIGVSGMSGANTYASVYTLVKHLPLMGACD